MQKKQQLFFVAVIIVLNQFLPLVLSWYNRPPTQEGKQTSQESASISESLRCN